MKRLAISLLALTVAACDPKKDTQGETAAPLSRRVSHADRPDAPASSTPPPMLHTPRIRISFTGTGSSHTIISDVAQADAILADIRTLPPSAGRDHAMSGILGDLAKVDPDAARARLAAWKDGLIPNWLDAAKAVAEHLGKKDPEGAARFIEESVLRASQVDIWGHFLTKLPPVARHPFFDRIPEGSEKIRIAADMITVWLPEDPETCAAWLDAFSAGRNADELESLGRPLRTVDAPKTGPDPWLVAYRAAKTSETRHFLAGAAWRRSNESEQATLMPELQEALPDLEDREWEEIIGSNPAGYAHALSNEQVAALSSADMNKLISSWSRISPNAAINWAMEHGRPEAAQALVSLYYLEPKTSISLAARLPQGKHRDQAVSSLCQSVAHDGDAKTAETLLPLITNPETRERTLREIRHDWK